MISLRDIARTPLEVQDVTNMISLRDIARISPGGAGRYRYDIPKGYCQDILWGCRTLPI